MKNEYLKNPCATLSIPYHKHKNISLPNNMLIVHDKDFDADKYMEYSDEVYFRLYHNMESINEISTENYIIDTAIQSDFIVIEEIINQCYDDIKVTQSQLQEYTKSVVYNPNLWIMIYEKDTGICVGCGIADFDSEMKELILEWIQVLPQYRGQGVGEIIVKELLLRMNGIADFATVSGKISNSTNPEKLYRKCGFTGNDIWHILRKE